MALSCISLTNFRNHNTINVPLSNLLYLEGDNGIGKTSIMEAIYLIITHKSFRQSSLSELKQYGSEFFRIAATFKSSFCEESVFFYDREKTFIIDGDKKPDVANYIWSHPAICYSPYFESFFSKEHFQRRNSLDRIIFYMDKNYMDNVKSYNALNIRKRAELLKDSPDKDVLNIINERITPLSASITAKRQLLVEKINECIKEDDTKIFPEGFSLSYRYSKGVYNINKEIDSKKVLYGAHKDLLYLTQNGKIIDKFQSFGQRKSCLLLILYYITTIIENTGKNCLLLLDDFEGGLDLRRLSSLYERFISSMGSLPRQIILSGIDNRLKIQDTFLLS